MLEDTQGSRDRKHRVRVQHESGGQPLQTSAAVCRGLTHQGSLARCVAPPDQWEWGSWPLCVGASLEPAGVFPLRQGRSRGCRPPRHKSEPQTH